MWILPLKLAGLVLCTFFFLGGGGEWTLAEICDAPGTMNSSYAWVWTLKFKADINMLCPGAVHWWSHCQCGPGDRRFCSDNHPPRVCHQHSAHHCSPHQHCSGLWPRPRHEGGSCCWAGATWWPSAEPSVAVLSVGARQPVKNGYLCAIWWTCAVC